MSDNCVGITPPKRNIYFRYSLRLLNESKFLDTKKYNSTIFKIKKHLCQLYLIKYSIHNTSVQNNFTSGLFWALFWSSLPFMDNPMSVYVMDNGGSFTPPGNDTSARCRMLIYDRWAYRMNMRWHAHFWPPKVSGGPLGGLKAPK